MKQAIAFLILAGVVFYHGGAVCQANSFSIPMTAYLPEIPGVTVALIEEEETIRLPPAEHTGVADESAATDKLPEEMTMKEEAFQQVVVASGQYQTFILRTLYSR